MAKQLETKEIEVRITRVETFHLKTCPSCESLEVDLDNHAGDYFIICVSCGVRGPIGRKLNAVGSWNEMPRR